MKIIQVISHEDGLIGLADDGQLYSMHNKNLGFGLIKPTWELYCVEYGPALTQSEIDQVTSYIAGYCYTSTDIFSALKDRYSSGVTVIAQTDKILSMLAKDGRVTITVEKVKLAVQVDLLTSLFNGIEIKATHADGKVETARLLNKKGGCYERY
jgi:hypothetical protein